MLQMLFSAGFETYDFFHDEKVSKSIYSLRARLRLEQHHNIWICSGKFTWCHCLNRHFKLFL